MKRTSMLIMLAALATSACSSSGPDGLGTPTGGTTGGNQNNGSGGGGGSNVTPPIPDKTALDDRVVSYSEALRTASLKLVRNLPTLQQIKNVAEASDQRAAYEAEIDAMLADPRFTDRMIKYWKDTMRQAGGAGQNGEPSRDTAPTFAARVTVEERPYTDLFTATSNNCPTYDAQNNAFNDGTCDSGAPVEAGVLTNPGTMMQFYGNMAFRRVRWVQEIFVCTKFPAEYATAPKQVNGADYTAPWAFESVATSPIDFRDTSSVVCNNCHATINHIAPLFANFDENGQWQNSTQVMTPTVPDPLPTELSHWLSPGEKLSWRLGQETPDLAALGQAMANDQDVKDCAVARMYNFAMSKEDIVTDLATVPPEVLAPYVDEFMKNGLSLKKTLRAILVSDDFVSF